MKKPRYLTKSRFKLGTECPTKLFYTGKNEYANNKMDDAFLAALAEGGFQVGELAKCYFPGGTDITTLDYEDALSQTDKLMKQDNAIIFEAAIRYKNLFIRADIMVKRGRSIQLIEVKAKSFDATSKDPFLTKKGSISSTWKPYLYDVAFQKYVLENAYPSFQVSAYLMLADKQAQCATDGLNQKFKIVRDSSNRKGIKVSSSLNTDDLKEKLLIQIQVDTHLEMIYSNDKNPRSFIEEIQYLATHYEEDIKIQSDVGAYCAGCEFRGSPEAEANGLRNGFKECWKEVLNWQETDFNEPSVLDIWNYRRKKDRIEERRIKIDMLTKADFEPAPDSKIGLSSSERRWLQVEKEQNKDTSVYFDGDGLSSVMRDWVFPLHFIDFETTMVAIPFNKGRRPYEAIAFQFSHHTVDVDGNVAHSGEFLSTQPGVFPNYEFVRALKNELDGDEGTIFMYSPHENTFLNHIYRQLMAEEHPPQDREHLCQFIKSITSSSGSIYEKWEGDRKMVDMLVLVKRFFYDPATKGSNSIKYVLPAILNSSAYLQEKYSKKIYGTLGGIRSHSFTDWQWIQIKDGTVEDPYKLLPKLFQGASKKNRKLLSEDDELKSGGAAMTAYARLQFEEMDSYERQELTKALLKYCELDTLAMVMIYEAWRKMIAR